MLTVYKYPLEIKDRQIIEMPSYADILSVGLDPSGKLCLWALVNTASYLWDEEIAIYGTGNPIDTNEDESLGFIGSVRDGPFMWHVFRVEDRVDYEGS